MDDYISRKALKEAFEQIDVDMLPEGWKGGRFCDGFGRKVVNEVIDSVPSVNVEPVRHGRWEQSIFAEDFKRCSVCSSIWSRTSNYCPHCGAKMDGGGEDAGD